MKDISSQSKYIVIASQAGAVGYIYASLIYRVCKSRNIILMY